MHGLRRGSGCCRGCRDRCGSVCGAWAAGRSPAPARSSACRDRLLGGGLDDGRGAVLHHGRGVRHLEPTLLRDSLPPAARRDGVSGCVACERVCLGLCSKVWTGQRHVGRGRARPRLLRTESSERPARCGAMARHRVPCWAIRLWMAASSSADHVLRWYPGLVGRPVESRASEPASASACISCDAACAAAAAAAVLALGVRVLVTAATGAALDASSCGAITPCVIPWAT